MFTIKVPYVIATHVKQFAAGSSLVNKKKATAFGSVDGQFLAKHTADAVISSVGAKNGATVSVVEYGFGGWLHQTIFTLTALPLTLVDANGLNGKGVLLYTFPVGQITVLNASGRVKETTTSVIVDTLNGAKTYNWGVGSTTQVNATLATTEQDMINTTNGTSSATINVEAAASSSSQVVAPLAYNGKTTAIRAFFNVGVAIDLDIDADATTTWNGTITMNWLLNANL